MIPLIKINRRVVSYSLIFLLLVPIFGFNSLISFISNILILIFLVPLLIVIVFLISFNSLKLKTKICNQCGNISLGTNNNCMNCGAELFNEDSNNIDISENPSQTTIEINAEEVN